MNIKIKMFFLSQMYEKPESKIINDFKLSGYTIQYIHTVHVVKGRVQRNHLKQQT